MKLLIHAGMKVNLCKLIYGAEGLKVTKCPKRVNSKHHNDGCLSNWNWVTPHWTSEKYVLVKSATFNHTFLESTEVNPFDI